MFRPRTYRNRVNREGLVSFEVIEDETDLFISAGKDLSDLARSAVLNCRKQIKDWIKKDPEFQTSLRPVKIQEPAPEIVRAMISASGKAGVGPMASVAGAIAEFVGRDLAASSDEVIVENGGDIFIKTAKDKTIGIYAGESSPFTGKLAIKIGPCENGIGICTSSGTVSHSLSFGKADAVVIISEDTALADAVATATANIVNNKADTEKALSFAKSISGVAGVLVIIGDGLGSWGRVTLV